MVTPVTPIFQNFQCKYCDEIFTRNYNLSRHVVRKHILEDNSTEPIKTKNPNDKTQNSHDLPKNTHCVEIKRCLHCAKDFSSKWYLNKHIEKCKGVKNKLQCEYCKKDFKHENSRFYHYKICTVKLALLKTEPQKSSNNISQNMTVTDHGTLNNNIDNRVNNNIIIVYNQSGDTPFSTEHLKAEDFKKILKLAAERLDNRILEEFGSQMFDNEENRCIKKTNLKAGHSQIHIGNNKWKLQSDKNIYPRLALNIANNMSEYIDLKREELKKDMYVRLRDFVDSMCDAGYINPDPTTREKELQKEYKTFMDGLKLIIYGNTKL